MKTFLFELGQGGYFFVNANDIEEAKGKFERSVGELGVPSNTISTIQPREIDYASMKQYIGTGSTSTSKTGQKTTV